jgi:plastocyanin
MDETLFYVFGIALVVSAFGVAFVGLRWTGFPTTRLAVAGLVAYFVALVAATTTFAVLNARDEQNKREAEEAAAAAEQQASSGGGETTATTTTTTGGGAAGKATTLKLSAETDTIAYDTTKLSAKRAGQVTIDFDNPSQVPHDVCLEGSNGDEIGCSETISQGTASLSDDLDAGKYTFYCSVDGHREAGMEGTLTVE